MKTVAIIDAGGANLGSVQYAIERFGIQPRLVREASGLEGATHVILPGVGAAPVAMARLHAQGLIAALRQLRVPLLGICLGMQLLYTHSEEGNTCGLGLLPGTVRALASTAAERIPHMGWNTLHPIAQSPLCAAISDGMAAYFVHSYAADVSSDTVATCMHSQVFAALVQRGTVCGAQFHPERSASVGRQIIANFLNLTEDDG